MQLQLSRFISSLGALTFVAANTERFSDLRCVLEFEYRPEFWFSHLEYVNFYGSGTIRDWDSLVITYIDEEYRDFLKKDVESKSEPSDFIAMNYLLLRVKVGDTLGKGMEEVDEYDKKMRKSTEQTFGRFVVDENNGTFVVKEYLVTYTEIVVRQLRKYIYPVIRGIHNVIRWGMGVSRNAGVIYKGAIYTISLKGHVWRVATLPTNFCKDYDPTAAPDLTERISLNIDRMWSWLESDGQAMGWVDYTDDSRYWEPYLQFEREDYPTLMWE